MTFTKAQQDAIDWALEKIKKFKRNEKIYNTSAIIFLILDFVCYFISIAYVSTVAISLIASIFCKTVWGARTIQLIKISRLATALKILTAPSLAYITVRKKRSEFMNNIKVQNWVVAILNIVAVIAGIVFVFVEPSALTENIEAVICGLGTLLGVNVAIPCFNNAKKSEEDLANQKAKENRKLAVKKVKAEQKELEKKLINEELQKIEQEQKEKAEATTETQTTTEVK